MATASDRQRIELGRPAIAAEGIPAAKLTNATVIGIKQFVAQQGGGPAAFETIGFAFEKIEHQSPKRKVLASEEIAKD